MAYPDIMTKTIIITGSSDGIGAAAARRLHQGKHRVVIVGRSPQKTSTVARELGVDHFTADFARLDDVRELAERLNATYPRIDVLANNAGGVFGSPVKTVDGFEMTFQINHLSPFLLTTLLMDKLIASSATVIQTSSVGAQQVRELDLDDLNHDRRFSAIRAYTAAKLENQMFTKELDRRYRNQGIGAACFHPGNVATNFAAGSDSRLMKFIVTNPLMRATFITPDQGAEQMVWLAESRPSQDWEPGEYYVKSKVTRPNRITLDPIMTRGLWERSEQFLARSGHSN